MAFVWGWLGVLRLPSSLSRVHIYQSRWCVVHTDASRATSTWRHEIHATVERWLSALLANANEVHWLGGCAYRRPGELACILISHCIVHRLLRCSRLMENAG